MKKNNVIAPLLLSFLVLYSQPIYAQEKADHYILSNFEGQGLFVTVNAIIGLLDRFETAQPKIGVTVDFGTDGLYYCPEKGPNWWSYYFEPIILGSQENVAFKRLSQGEISNFCWSGGRVISRARAHELLMKYIKVKPEVQKVVDEFAKSYFQEYFIVGIHYRGTDKFIESAPYVAYAEVLSQLETVLQYCHKPTKIFVATDEQRFLDFMKTKYRSQIIHQNIYRSSNNSPLHFIHHDKYKNGLDAVTDCLLLSKCPVLLKTASNLSACSLLFNPSIYVVNLSSER